MGMVFIIWDRIFGTFSAEMPGELPHYGITKPVEKPFHPVHIVTHEWVEIGRDLKKRVPFTTKLKYIFNAPGWSHDGSTKTAKQLQRDWRRRVKI